MKRLRATLSVGLGWFLFACAGDEPGARDGGVPNVPRDAGATDAAVAEDAGPPPATFVLGLALGDAVDDRAPRGWPCLLSGVAALAADDRVTLDAASLALRIEGADGVAEPWPLERLTPLGDVALDDTTEQVQITWALTAEQTRALALGRRTARLIWAGESSAAIDVDVVDLPATNDPAMEALRTRRRVSLEARAALLAGDPARALAALDAALDVYPDDAALLVWRGKAHAAAGDLDSALVALDTAAALVGSSDEEPAVTVFENRRPILEQLIGSGP